MKGISTKSRKIDPPPPLSAKCSYWLDLPSPLVRADTPYISRNPKFFAPKSVDVRI